MKTIILCSCESSLKKVIKLFMLNSTILLMNVKMPTVVGILTFISRINIVSESFPARTIFIMQYFSFIEQLKFHAQLS